MASTINALTGSGGVAIAGDSSGILEFQSNGTTVMTVSSASQTTLNRIINGDMAINQRGSGALENGFLVDRFSIGSSQASKGSATVQTADVPAKFTSALKYTSSTAYSVLATDYFFVTQKIEGNNIADLDWGTADAQTITLSFWVKSSLTGTFGGALRNSAINYNYPYTYTISSANTWEKKSVTITGPTSGTWLTTNGTGIDVWFSLGMGTTYSDTAGAWTTTAGLGSATGATSVVGTSGATWLVTGVQLEAGGAASNFENLQYGQQLALCQRYYEKSYNQSTVPATGEIAGAASSISSSTAPTQGNGVTFKVTKRAAPTMAIYNGVTGAVGYSYRVSDASSVATTFSHIGEHGAAYINIPSSANGYYFHFTAASEL
tara:strand:- start:122 stop:1252 length:1131 start_codon:yes stop_codon:yes gene_type:complete